MKEVVLVTGAGKGLGRVIAKTLLDKGLIVYGTYRSSDKSKIRGVTYLKMDVTSDKECKSTVAKILKEEKRINILINCAGITVSGPTLDYSSDDFMRVLDTNVVGAFRLIKFAQNSKLRLIINITSLNGFLSLPNYGLYSSSKFAIEALGKALKCELQPKVKVVNIAPGALHNKNQAKKMTRKPIRERFPLVNFLLPLTKMEDVAGVIVKLIDKKSVPSRIIVGRDAMIINIFQKILPQFVLDKLFANMTK